MNMCPGAVETNVILTYTILWDRRIISATTTTITTTSCIIIITRTIIPTVTASATRGRS